MHISLMHHYHPHSCSCALLQTGNCALHLIFNILFIIEIDTKMEGAVFHWILSPAIEPVGW